MQLKQRKRPSQRRSEVTVELVLEAAARILEEKGLSGFNTNAIAARAGISIGSLYQYFPCKEAITAALMLHRQDRILRDFESLLKETEGMSIGYAIGALLHMLIGSLSRRSKFSRIIEMEQMRLHPPAEALAREAELVKVNRAFFGRYIDLARCTEEQLDNAARDTICIVRAMLEQAGDMNALDAPDLHARLYRTVEGYLAPLLLRP